MKGTTLAARVRLLEDAKAVITEDLGTDLSVDGVASRIATSRRQLQRCFRELENATFREYVTRVRMERAAAMLALQPRWRVRDIARAVGYRQPAQFAKAFRRVHGVSPTEYAAGVRQRSWSGDAR